MLCPECCTSWLLRAKALNALQCYTDMLASVPIMHALSVPSWREEAEQASAELQGLFDKLPAFMSRTASADAEDRSEAWKELATADPTSLQARTAVYSEWLQMASRMRQDEGGGDAPEEEVNSWTVASQAVACLRECAADVAAFRAAEEYDPPDATCLTRQGEGLRIFLQHRRPNVPLAAYGEGGADRAEADIELNLGLAIELAARMATAEERAEACTHYARSARLHPTPRIFLLWGRAAERQVAQASVNKGTDKGRAAVAVVWQHAVAAGVWLMPTQRPEFLLRALSARPWHDPQHFEACRALVREFATIRAEALSLLRQDTEQHHFRSYQSEALDYGDWCDVGLYYNGMRNDVNAERAPCTSALLCGEADGFRRDCTSCSIGSAYFSLLRPHTRLAAHCGPTNARLRAHLGLVVPAGDCEIIVGGESRRWLEGEVLLFDDSFEHAVHNETEEARLVLIVDMWHPELQSDAQRVGALQTAEQCERYKAVVQRGVYESTTLRGH